MIRLLVADDHQIVRAGLVRLIGDQPDMKVAAEAASGNDVLRLIEPQSVDLVLLDIAMPECNGIDCLRLIRARHPDLPVLMLSGYPESHYAVNTMRAGASGYVSKLASPEEILRAIRIVAQGRKYVSDRAASLLATEIARSSPTPAHEDLSEREFQVFLRLAQGEPTGTIAAQLGLSVKTVTTYRARLLQKMGLATNADLTQYALRNGLLD